MSHAATKWAFDQPELHRDMKPSEWAVLMVLADCHNPVNGCFPSQDYICSKTNLAERAVRDQLTRLRERGLIDWDTTRENGRRGSNRYTLGFENDFQPANFAGCSTGEIEQEQPADSDSFYRQNLPPNPVREPVKEPEREGASARDREKSVERWLKRQHPHWPSFVSDSETAARRAALDLTADERDAAADRMGDYLAAEKGHGRCAFSTYLSEKRWERLPPKSTEPQIIEAAPFGKLWGCIRMARLLAGVGPIPAPTGFVATIIERGGEAAEREMSERRKRYGYPSVNRMDEQASMGRGHSVRPDDRQLERVAATFEQVRVGSELWEAWRHLHGERDWPWLPDPGKQEWVYFPAGGPENLQEFQNALRGENDAGQPQAAE